MRKVKNKSKRTLADLLRGQDGFSVMVIIFVMLVLTAIGYSMTRMMATKQKSVPVTAHSSSAFYVAEGGINYAGKYLSDSDHMFWISLPDQTKSLGNGSFTVTFSDYCTYGDCSEGGTKMCVTATSTGTYGDGTRVLATRFCRDEGYGCM